MKPKATFRGAVITGLRSPEPRPAAPVPLAEQKVRVVK